MIQFTFWLQKSDNVSNNFYQHSTEGKLGNVNFS